MKNEIKRKTTGTNLVRIAPIPHSVDFIIGTPS